MFEGLRASITSVWFRHAVRSDKWFEEQTAAVTLAVRCCLFAYWLTCVVWLEANERTAPPPRLLLSVALFLVKRSSLGVASTHSPRENSAARAAPASAVQGGPGS